MNIGVMKTSRAPSFKELLHQVSCNLWRHIVEVGFNYADLIMLDSFFLPIHNRKRFGCSSRLRVPAP